MMIRYYDENGLNPEPWFYEFPRSERSRQLIENKHDHFLATLESRQLAENKVVKLDKSRQLIET